MSNSGLARKQALFQRCLDRPAEEWDAILADACGDDIALRNHVRRLLDRHRDTHAEESGFMRLEGSDPERIGPYRILQRLGEGGMGIVYAAEQRDPVRRRVAVKVLRSGHNSSEVLARFDIERQALALMSHTNIARILDAGTTADRRPFIVMEFVPGETITRYCERRDLPLRERLELFCEVCDAVQHAHQRGVIHRDIKPSNILVMEEDSRTIPKVIDFGIAKAITQRLTDRTLETRVGSLLGTPDYMSPEQAELSPLDVDTRTDVYGLGAVLYQLLTGVPPLELASSGKNFVEVQHAIHEQVPLSPSQRVGGVLQRRLRGELDWITMKALEKQRAHRYASPADLAEDLRSHLVNGTVNAGPPSKLRAMDKFVRRHWIATASALVVAMTLTVSQVALVQKNRELQAERDRVRNEAAVAESVTAFLLDIFEASDPGGADAGRTTARELLDRAHAQINDDQLLDPDVRLQLLAGIGSAYGHLGVHAKAIGMLSEADRLASLHASPERRLQILGRLGLIHELVHESEEARQVLERALEIAAANGITRLSALFDMRRALASLESDLGDATTARDMLLSLLADARREFGRDDVRTLDVGTRLVYIHTTLAEYQEAERLTAVLLPLAEQSLDDGHPMISYLRGNLAGVYMALDRWDEAETIARSIHAKFIEQFGPDSHPVQSAIVSLAITTADREEGLRLLLELAEHQRAQFGDDSPELILTIQNTGWIYSRIPGREREARDFYERAFALAVRHRGEEHNSLRTIRYGLAVLDARAGKLQDALRHLRTALQSRTLQHRAARDKDFAPLHKDPAFPALLGDFADDLPGHTGESGE